MIITYSFTDISLYTLLFTTIICGIIVLSHISKRYSEILLLPVILFVLFVYTMIIKDPLGSLIHHGRPAIEINKGLKIDGIDQIIRYQSINRLERKLRPRKGKRKAHWVVEIELSPAFNSYNLPQYNHKTWFERFSYPSFYSKDNSTITISCDHLSIDCKQLVELINKDRIN